MACARASKALNRSSEKWVKRSSASALARVPLRMTWADLFDPRLKDKMIIADPANSSTALTILWGVERMLGAEGLKRLAQNIKVTSAAATVLRSVGQGEFAVGLTFESNAYAYVAGGQNEITLVYPADGTVPPPAPAVLGSPRKCFVNPSVATWGVVSEWQFLPCPGVHARAAMLPRPSWKA